ncbi:hypothetical protein HHI36_003042 [Cryptolaemus montrouzieri]|uniref:Uncharacterized protein n=1 Tax=Cryptolaemus montrouzieri TaxID=559131 RepID=A0ABD2PDT1_9CUCU
MNNTAKTSESVIIGKKTATDDTSEPIFRARESKLWIYVGRWDPQTDDTQIKDYLEKNSPGYTLVVQKLQSKKQTRDQTTSFRIAAHKDLQDVIYDPTYWPQAVMLLSTCITWYHLIYVILSNIKLLNALMYLTL